MKKYLKPTIDIVSLSYSSLLASSGRVKHLCGSSCKFWHICQDRNPLGRKECDDFQYKD